MKIYKTPTVEIPTNVEMVRADRNDQIYKTKDGKWNAVINHIQARHEAGQPILVGTISVEVSEMISERAEAPRDRARRAQREARVRRARGRDGRPGRPRRGHDRHQHGRPRRRHQARRRPGAARGRRAAQARRHPGARELGLRARRAHRALPRADAGRGRQDPRGRRPLHLRNRAPRVAPDRQPAPRSLGASGRSRRVALLPLGRGRPDPPVRGRADLQDPRPPGTGRRGRARSTRSRRRC